MKGIKMIENFFTDAKIIFSYTRAQAIEDGVLVDVSEVAKKHGFKFPVAMTEGVWKKCIADAEKSVDKQLLLFLRKTFYAIKNSKDGGALLKYSYKTIQLKLHCGPGDNFEPVLTIMLPNED